MIHKETNVLPGFVFTILIVDDSDFTLLTESMLLKQLGYRIFTANSAKRALKILEKRYVDLVLTDINMPEMCGDELARHIHQGYPELPVIAATTACAEQLNAVQTSCFNAVLKKPLTANMVRETMRECLQST